MIWTELPYGVVRVQKSLNWSGACPSAILLANKKPANDSHYLDHLLPHGQFLPPSLRAKSLSKSPEDALWALGPGNELAGTDNNAY